MCASRRHTTKMPRPSRTTSQLLEDMQERVRALEETQQLMGGWFFRLGLGGSLEIVREDGAVKARIQS